MCGFRSPYGQSAPRVRPRHSVDQDGGRSTVIFVCDQFPLPSQQSIGRDDCRDIRQHIPADQADFSSQTTSLLVGKAKAPGTQLSPKDPILLPQIRNRMLLLLIHPARNGNQQKAEWIQCLRHVFCRLTSRIGGHAAVGVSSLFSCRSSFWIARGRSSRYGRPGRGRDSR
jgi:hypothetical protein